MNFVSVPAISLMLIVYSVKGVKVKCFVIDAKVTVSSIAHVVYNHVVGRPGYSTKHTGRKPLHQEIPPLIVPP